MTETTTPSAAGGWPALPGVPLNPDLYGWHWLAYCHANDRTIFPKLWDGSHWIEAAGHPRAGASLVCVMYRYLAPVITPTQHAAAIEAARREGLDERDRLIAHVDQLRRVLAQWEHTGCPDCSGDCYSANPPMIGCIMQETRAVLAPTRTDGSDA